MSIKYGFFTLLSVFTAYPTLQAQCPSYLEARNLPPQVLGKPHNEFAFASWQAQGWQLHPFQIDPLDEQGLLQSMTLPQMKLQNTHRFVVRPNDFGAKIPPDARVPCEADWGGELQINDPHPKFGYIFHCNNPQSLFKKVQMQGATEASTAVYGLVNEERSRPSNAADGPFSTGSQDHAPYQAISVDRNQGMIKSQKFLYQHVPNNILLFQDIKINHPPWRSAVQDANLWLHLDLIKMFSLDFDRSNMDALVEQSFAGPLSVSHTIAFYIQLLFFKIDLELATLFSFYETSAHAPMRFYIPANTKERLNRGSGMFLHWMPQEATLDLSDRRFTTPLADPAEILRGKASFVDKGLRQCVSKQCTFEITLNLNKEKFRIQTTLDETYVARGFFPQLVGNVSQFLKDMGWDDDTSLFKNRVGVFFDNTDLPMGDHQIDHWFYLVNPLNPTARCPLPLALTNLIHPRMPLHH